MSRLKNEKIRYFYDRCNNAYRMMKTGRFGLMWKSAWIEIDKRIKNTRAKLLSFKDDDLFFLKLDKRRVSSVSYCPTVTVASVPVNLKGDEIAIANELQRIRSTFVFQQHSD